MQIEEDLVSSCIVCRKDSEKHHCECLYDEKNSVLSACGSLYVESFGLQIEEVALKHSQYLCHKCELQMQLFKKLKEKAIKNFEELKQSDQNAAMQQCYEALQFYAEHNNADNYNELQVVKDIDENALGLPFLKLENFNNETPQNSPTLRYIDDIYEYFNVDSSSWAISVDTSSFKDESQEMASAHMNADGSANKEIFLDVQFLDEVLDENTETKSIKRSKSVVKNKKQCKACNCEFQKQKELSAHRKVVHFNKHPCNECPKLLKTADALRVHMKQHRGERAYKCTLCPKSFHQKGHYQYHMNKHNNIRNFKCTLCEKAFLAKADLSIHMRTHNGERPYSCNICNKSYLLLQHLKMHKYSHLLHKTCVCLQCNQKFISPATLRTHEQTIHNTQPQFECEYCVRKFRRKHHLVSHQKVHKKAEMKLDKQIAESNVQLQRQIKEDEEYMTYVEIDGISEIESLTFSKMI